jgi:hypothetical protein
MSVTMVVSVEPYLRYHWVVYCPIHLRSQPANECYYGRLSRTLPALPLGGLLSYPSSQPASHWELVTYCGGLNSLHSRAVGAGADQNAILLPVLIKTVTLVCDSARLGLHDGDIACGDRHLVQIRLIMQAVSGYRRWLRPPQGRTDRHRQRERETQRGWNWTSRQARGSGNSSVQLTVIMYSETTRPKACLGTRVGTFEVYNQWTLEFVKF